MEVVFMIFMTFVSVVALFAVMVVVRDVVKESYLTKRINNAAEREREAAMREAILAAIEAGKVEGEQKAAEAEEAAPAALAAAVEPEAETVAQPAAEEPVAEEPAVEEPVAEEPAVEEPAAEESEAEDGTVSFAASTTQTLEEKYMELSAEQKHFYDDIIKYAAAKEGSRRYYNQRYEEYKIGSKRIVRLRIKRGVVYCEFLLTNSDFRNYISENKIPVKQAATVIKVVDAATVDAVKNSIDIAVQLIAEEREYKKQLAREKRKQAREQSKA